jgi:hypothetical protein
MVESPPDRCTLEYEWHRNTGIPFAVSYKIHGAGARFDRTYKVIPESIEKRLELRSVRREKKKIF